MKLLRPVTITDAMLTSSTVPENDHPAWSAGTSYVTGNRVILSSTHRRYEALAASTGVNPATDPTKWLDLGPTNRWAMFDARVGTATTRTASLQAVLASGAVDAVALIDTDAETATVTLTVDGVTNYTSTQSFNLGGSAIDNWFSWFFEPIGRRSTLLFLDVPVYANGVVTVTIKHISITTGGIVIPANASVAFPLGATIVIYNDSATAQTISITTDTLRQAGTANTGSRTLDGYGLATLVKVAATTWVITGAGLN